MRTKRVLHVLKYYWPQFAGEGVFLERCAPFMQALAPAVEHELLATVTSSPSEPPAGCSSLSRVYYLSRKQLSGWRHQLALLAWFIRHLHRFDVVHFRTHADWRFLSYFVVKLCRRRLVLSATLDDSPPALTRQYRRSTQGLVRRLFRVFDAFVTISPKLYNETIASLPDKRCEMIPCGITLPETIGRRHEIRRSLGLADDTLVLIFVGGLCLRKDPLFLVEQLPNILQRHPDTCLLLVGPELEGNYVAQLHDTVRRENLSAHVIFVGQVADPHPYFQASDIMVFSSLREGFGTVVPEAQANGLPVVVRHLPGVNDLFVKNGETGFLFTDAAGFQEAVARLAADATLRGAVGERARTLVRKSFDMASVARRYLGVYGLPVPEESSAAVRGTEDMRFLGSDASIINRPFREEAVISPRQRPILLTLVDAEEAFDWSLRPFSRVPADVSSMRDQERAHRIFERHGVTPTYMVDYAVAAQQEGCAPLLELLADRRCDIGAQLHAWVTPPFQEELSARNSYAGNLGVVLEYEKTRILTETIEAALGVRPRIFRSGRFGAGSRTGDVLKRLGYLADSSVMPGWSFKRQGGPDYVAMPSTPFWIDAEHTVLEIPGTAGFVGRLARASAYVKRLQYSSISERLFWPALSSRLGLLERIRLTPEGVTCDEAKRLVRYLFEADERVFALTYHSPSLRPGCTPYVRNEQDLLRFLGWLDEFYDFFVRELNGELVTWRDVFDRVADCPKRVTTTHEAIVA